LAVPCWGSISVGKKVTDNNSPTPQTIIFPYTEIALSLDEKDKEVSQPAAGAQACDVLSWLFAFVAANPVIKKRGDHLSQTPKKNAADTLRRDNYPRPSTTGRK
jgi:hypothetical protein